MIKVAMAQDTRNRGRAMTFVRRHVRRLYGGTPPPSKILFFVEHNHRICGVIALDFALPGKKFALENIYKFDHAMTPWHFERQRIAQFSKWWTTRPGVAVHLMYAAHQYALEQGKQVGLVEVKPHIVAHVEKFGMSLTEIPQATLQIQGISSRGERYYQLPPPPRLYMFDIRTNAMALERYIQLDDRS